MTVAENPGRSKRRAVVVSLAGVALLICGVLIGTQLGQTDEPSDADSATSATQPAVDDVEVSTADEAEAESVDDVSVPDAEPALPSVNAGVFVETFDGSPDAPTPWNGSSWDITVHSRAIDTWEELDEIEAEHGPDCGPPTETHSVSDYPGSVYQCRDHVMTALFGADYSMAYLTPNAMVDFSEGEAVITFDISTLRTTTRDWWDVWITPYDDHLQLPLDRSVDAQGVPRDSIRVGLGVQNQIRTILYDDFEAVDFGTYPTSEVTPVTRAGYETFLEPDAARRDTFEIRLTKNHIRVGMPEYDFWWVDTDIPELDWDTGVVQFGHHSYNPLKSCNQQNSPIPEVDECSPMTWHWDNVSIEPAVEFTIVGSQERTAVETDTRIDLSGPIPENGRLRFSAIGENIRVRFDDGDWVDAEPQESGGPIKDGHFTSYFIDAPAGATRVEFAGDPWRGNRDWHVRDVSAWSPTPQGS